MKLEIFFYKAPQDSQKPEKNSGQSFENRTISGNPYYLVLEGVPKISRLD